MNIIGKTKQGYIIDASKKDVAKLMGFYWHGDDGCKMPEVGDELDINGLFDRCSEARRILFNCSEIRHRALEVLRATDDIRAIVPASKKDVEDSLRSIFINLSSDEREVVERLYGLNEFPKMTKEETAETTGKSVEEVEQIRTEALKRMHISEVIE